MHFPILCCVQDSPAEASFFSSQNWEIARECLNDIFAPDDDDDEDGGDSGLTDQVRRAFISEARSVWTGRTPLSQASAQIRLNWPVIRDCVDRYTNQNNPPSAQAEFLGETHVYTYMYMYRSHACRVPLYCICQWVLPVDCIYTFKHLRLSEG